ncbi:MAG: PAS domain-containing protein, partial [Oscillospiraceae bacterium]|nr:PAS domain-containing protein [Oscillospiraceae bacterium]
EDELNCGSCGYNTCQEKAAAIVKGKADVSMCLPYLMERAKSFSDTIINNSPNGILLLTETLEVQQMNAAACEITNVTHPQDVLGHHVSCIMDPALFWRVVDTRRNITEERVYLAEYDRYIMLNVIYDNSYNVVIGIMRDVTVIEKNKAGQKELNRKTMEVTDKVIEKQMRTVQEIASLLGETTAETMVALTKLKETLSDE